MIPFLTEVLELVVAALVLAGAADLKKIFALRKIRCVSLISKEKMCGSNQFIRVRTGGLA
ncbi:MULTISPECIES: hypothetical protein [unclassified Roseovarius]|uniref:hypothetical protein n=1 Tax=unclassified Roseovarius TaxID=2614913 RepID=UPI00273F1B87|nr:MULTISPECIES: hypothetical protein [unclassified Roseovarius]